MGETVKKFAWSYSALTSFETCPRRHKLTRIDKVVTEPQSEHIRHGNEVHKAMELHLKKEKPLPEKYKDYRPYADAVLQQEGKLLVEHKVALNKSFKPTGYFDSDVWVRGVFDVALIRPSTGKMLDWKGLPLDTPLPTPAGFTSMKDVEVGDEVLSSSGAPCRVVGKSKVNARPCFTVEFDDRTTVVCDNVHLWPTLRGVVPVTELVIGDAIPVAKPAQHTEKPLPIDPYVFGLWLADGKHTSSEITKPDEFVWEEIARRGYKLGSVNPSAVVNGKAPTRTVKGIRAHLRALDVLGNKHIPDCYLGASVDQRTDLLRGLMDGDGNANPTRKQVVFTTVSRRLSDDVKQLAESLGQRVNQSVTTQRGFGLTVTAYPLAWRPLGLNPFLLPRKAERVKDCWGPGKSNVRRVASVTPTAELETQCIAVDSPDNTFLCTRSYIPTHNTGKPKPDPSQLQLFAAMGFASFPYVQKFDTGFVWLGHKKLNRNEFDKDEAPGIWREFIVRVARMESAIESDKFPANPSGLCRAHCPVPKSMCEFSGRE